MKFIGSTLHRLLLVVTHEMSFARDVADRILFMDQGKVIEDASPDTFFSNPQSDRAKAFLEAHRTPGRGGAASDQVSPA